MTDQLGPKAPQFINKQKMAPPLSNPTGGDLDDSLLKMP
jgi:hypothetical protein